MKNRLHAVICLEYTQNNIFHHYYNFKMQVLKQLQIPYSFAKRHGVLLRYESDQAFIVRREVRRCWLCKRHVVF